MPAMCAGIQELAILRGRIEKLEFYVAQLDKRQAEVIRKYYFEEKTWPELQKEKGMQCH